MNINGNQNIIERRRCESLASVHLATQGQLFHFNYSSGKKPAGQERSV